MIDIKDGSASEVAEQINSLLAVEEIQMMLSMVLKGAKVSVIAEGNKLNICVPFEAFVAQNIKLLAADLTPII